MEYYSDLVSYCEPLPRPRSDFAQDDAGDANLLVTVREMGLGRQAAQFAAYVVSGTKVIGIVNLRICAFVNSFAFDSA